MYPFHISSSPEAWTRNKKKTTTIWKNRKTPSRLRNLICR
ncbi:hypothetical protein V6Z12_D01G154600 [Gossypium hirsutum]